MKIKVYQAFAFQMLYARLKDEPLPLKVSLRMTKIYNEVTEATDAARESLAEVLNKFGEKDEEGKLMLTEDKQSVQIKDGAQEACAKALAELQNQDITIRDIKKFSIDDLDEVQITASEVQALLPFVDMDLDEE